MILSWLLAGPMSFKEWFQIVFFAGARKIARHMTLLSNRGRREYAQKATWEVLFEIWWGFSIKYFIPTVLSFVMFNTLKTNVEKPYGGYPIGTNFIGWTLVLISILLAVIPIFFCTEYEPFGMDVDQPFEEMDKKYFEDLHKADADQKKDEEQSESKEPKPNEEQVNQSNQIDHSSKSIMRKNTDVNGN